MNPVERGNPSPRIVLRPADEGDFEALLSLRMAAMRESLEYIAFVRRRMNGRSVRASASAVASIRRTPATSCTKVAWSGLWR